MRLAERELGLYAARAGKHDPYNLHRSVGVYAARFAARSLRKQRVRQERQARSRGARRIHRADSEHHEQHAAADNATEVPPSLADDGDDGKWSVVSAPADEPGASLSGVRAVRAPFEEEGETYRPFGGWLNTNASSMPDASRRLDLSGRMRTDRQRIAAS